MSEINKNIHIRTSEPNILGLKDLVSFLCKKIPNFEMVEIGCYAGESSSIFATKAKKVFCVDPWKNNYSKIDSAAWKNDMALVEEQFDIRTKLFNNVVKIKDTSVNASNKFEDNSLDFVYIDGDHSFEAVNTDIQMWIPKVKKGCYIGGHDILFKDVALAVFNNFNLLTRVFSDSSWMVYKK